MITRDELTSLIDGWSKNRRVLGRLLNTCSYLEHLASKKMLTATVSVTDLTLQHANEMTRHASFFKRALRGVWHGDFSRYDDHMLIGGRAAVGYLQKMDVVVRKAVKDAKIKASGDAQYFIMAWLVETRANMLYPLMNDVFAAARIPVSLRNVIADHEKFLAEVQEQIGKIPKLKPVLMSELLIAEEQLFNRFIIQMQQDTVRVAPKSPALEPAQSN